MQATTTARRATALLVAVAAAVGLAVSLASAANAGGVTRDQLAAQGWRCVSHPFAAPVWYRCFNPATVLPFPGSTDRPPTYQYVQFEIASGAFVGAGHMIRGDLYRGQQCGSTGTPYIYLPGIQYYDCP
jgi:hypothetical protein